MRIHDVARAQPDVLGAALADRIIVEKEFRLAAVLLAPRDLDALLVGKGPQTAGPSGTSS